MRTALIASVAAAAVLSAQPAHAHQAKAPVPAYGCDGAPADAVLVLPAPAGHWMRIVCTETGHTLAPIPGDAWQIVQDSRPLTISAAPEQPRTAGRHGSYFVGAAVERLRKDAADVARARFVEKAGFELPPIAAAYAVYLTTNSGERDAIYVFLDASGPAAGLACLGTCEKTVAATVTHPEEESPSQ